MPGFNLGNIRAPHRLGGGFRSYPSETLAALAIRDVVARYPHMFSASTLRDIIRHYSPPSENRTEQLIKDAARRTGIKPGEKLNFSDPNVSAKLVYAIGTQEGKIREGEQSRQHISNLLMPGPVSPETRASFGHPHQAHSPMNTFASHKHSSPDPGVGSSFSYINFPESKEYVRGSRQLSFKGQNFPSSR